MTVDDPEAVRAELLPKLGRLLRNLAEWRRHNQLRVHYSRPLQPPEIVTASGRANGKANGSSH